MRPLLRFACAVLCGLAGASAQTFELVRTFPGTGETPISSLVKDAAGDFLGVTFLGGAAGFGAVCKATPGGTLTTLASFNGANGTSPSGPLTKANDGRYYGVTHRGGTGDRGIIYRISADGLEKVAQFTGANGANPQGRLALGTDGNLYGVASGGPAPGSGVIFKLTPAKVLSVVAKFTGANGEVNPMDGAIVPASGLIRGSDGNFYGVTPTGGTNDQGVAFKVTPAGAITVLVQFGGTNPRQPNGGLVEGSDGNFYGTTTLDGANNSGAVFKITPAGDFSIVASLEGANGAYPYGELLEVGAGTFYGTARNGGANGAGIVFKVTTAGVLTKVADCSAANGAFPVSGFVLGDDGDLYTTASGAGTFSRGTVFKTATAGTLSAVAHFGQAEGIDLAPGLTAGADGNLYGIAVKGGAENAGTFYRLTTAGVFTKLADFPRAAVGTVSSAPLALGADGKLYGSTRETTTNSHGAIFSATTAGTLTKLADFDGASGSDPNGLMLASDGNFYGTTNSGGANNRGTIVRYSAANGIEKLFDFSDASGHSPEARLVEGRDGALYGTAPGGGSKGFGTVFRITTGGEFKVLANFSKTNGRLPVGPLALGADGNFYGLTYAGGAIINNIPFDNGVVYRITPAGKLTALSTLNALTGGFPKGGFVVGPGGNLYATALIGGGAKGAGIGTVIKVTTKGVVSVLKIFDGVTSGLFPASTPSVGPDGNLYGSSISTVFRLVTNNAAPVATDDTLVLPVIRANVRRNDTDANGDPIRIVSVTDGAHGSVAIEADGTLTYVPDGTFTTTDSFTYTIADPLGGTDTATVNVSLPLSPITAGLGAYAGMLDLGGTPRGYCGIVVSAGGAFTGGIYLDGVKTPLLLTKFTAAGTFQKTIARPGRSSLVVSLTLDPGRNQITGTVDDGTTVFAVNLVRTFPAFATTRTTDRAGRYTALLTLTATGMAGEPQGTGFATITISTLGAVKIIGRTGDGATFSFGTRISHDDRFPLYATLYSGKGYLAGLIDVLEKPGSDANGILAWRKFPISTGLYTAGFNTQLNLTASLYAAARPVIPLAMPPGNAKLVFDTLGLTKMLSVSTANSVVVSNPAADATAMRINATTGTFSGTFKHPADGVVRSFAGAIFQKTSPRGQGYFTGPASAEKITFSGTP